MNETIARLMNHRSVRKYTSRPVERERLETIISAAQMASSSSNVQAYTAIAVTDPQLKDKLAGLAGDQPYIRECPVFLVWCADLSRLKAAAERHASDKPSYEGAAENFVVATVDAALASQNAAVAAESLGLGIVYIGGVRNDIAAVSEALNLPDYVYPVFGMCVGYPDPEHGAGIRPRLPLETVLHMNGYSAEQSGRGVQTYDETTVRYISDRTGGRRTAPWSKLMADKLTAPSRLHMKSFLESKGFNKE
ncbi:oxygen-insensitive NADPH nitroreductase [Saccharibacillus sp. CPCC 101409]|uniref:oxygen-insensitive NADPH nitroreductase n=1 Tax=Saccharibacillus sp. CPCC 101409 TaxID=3058041 RepID=UPI002673B749|nr:oxygen-insensitive NADPH nitroreductase [Saccharibacillus sp. CPCC 101409]MDO3411305.1 oxygen-insensitive NADPH nitroreductase [Saccharibacillus sp. CPCC 101409]